MVTRKQPHVPELHVGRGSVVDGLTVFPVWADVPVVTGVDTGSFAAVRVQERPGSPVVGELVVTDLGRRPALLVEGEMLEGGWQHRTLVKDIILPPGVPQVVQVACVERGRWHGSPVQHRKSRRSSAGVRARLRQTDHGRQHAVWDQVEQYAPVTGCTPTQSLADQMDLLLDRAAPRRNPRPLPGQCGVVVGVAGRPLLLELFGSGRALAAHLPGLLDGVLLDAALAAPNGAVEVPGRLARGLASGVGGRPLEEVGEAGCGIAVDGSDARSSITGVALASGRLAHLTVLNTRHPLLEASWN